MTILAFFDTNGLPIGFYPMGNGVDYSAVDFTNAVEITEAERQEFIDNPGLRCWVNGEVEIYQPPPPTASQLAASLVQSASMACATLTAAIVPDATHQNAYVNANQMVGVSATVPTVDPAKTAFATLATILGFGTNLQGFATLVTQVAASSLQLSAALAALEHAALAPDVTTAQLATALAAFETGLAAVVSAINGVGLSIAAPAAISIAGLNA